MRQEVNLLDLEPVVKPPIFSFTVLLISIGVCVVLLSFTSVNQHKNLSEINKDVVTIEKNNIFLQKNTINVDDISKFQNQLSGLEKQLLNKYQLWANYKKITNTGKEGFSQYFYYIATLADTNLSLYEIHVYDRGASLALKGYSKKAEYIPVYINDLKSQNELQSVNFGDLSIEKIEGHEILRFALEKKQKKEDDKKRLKEKKIDISEIMKMSLTTIDDNVAYPTISLVTSDPIKNSDVPIMDVN